MAISLEPGCGTLASPIMGAPKFFMMVWSKAGYSSALPMSRSLMTWSGVDLMMRSSKSRSVVSSPSVCTVSSVLRP